MYRNQKTLNRENAENVSYRFRKFQMIREFGNRMGKSGKVKRQGHTPSIFPYESSSYFKLNFRYRRMHPFQYW